MLHVVGLKTPQFIIKMQLKASSASLSPGVRSVRNCRNYQSGGCIVKILLVHIIIMLYHNWYQVVTVV